ncbi:RNA polymerase II C-terminal domain phosphatase-like 5 [Cardamine amara subsp. amara]|uniref:protein-serine/threonine phosphatase n=1 Tax=Cardamine amara subsp. amara TaxID=228776 RepID=A0ABD0ZZF2_CARAN
MAAPCKHWILHRQICCRCRSPVKTYDTNKRVAKATSLYPNCRHRMYQNRLCCRCGSFLDIWDFARAFNYIAKSLQMSPAFEAVTKQQKLRIGLGKRKLHLVLSLEHTLIDHINVSKLSEIDRYHLIKEADSGSRDDLFIFRKENFYSSDALVKFRPFVREFLREANEIFTMHVFTNYGPGHAKKVVKLLDPHMIYFGNRIITSRDSNGGLKSVELVLAEPRGVLVVDYDHRLWVKRDHRHVIVMSKYVYFKDISNEIGVLAKTLNFLKMSLKGDNKLVDFEGKREETPDDDHRLLLKVIFESLKVLHNLFFNGRYQDVIPLLPRVFYAVKFA